MTQNENQAEPRCSALFFDDIGTEITMYAQNPAQMRELQRHYGKSGWRVKREERRGGLILPYDQHDSFDFSLLGARFWKSPEGETLLLCGGHAYRQRILEQVDSRKMQLPAAIKYSRGAKPSDPPHLVEKAEGEFAYVTLVVFKTAGKAHPSLSLPQGQVHPLAVNAASQVAA